jgi:hypothetical protein
VFYKCECVNMLFINFFIYVFVLYPSQGIIHHHILLPHMDGWGGTLLLYRRLTQYLSLMQRVGFLLQSFVVLMLQFGIHKKFESDSTVYDRLGPLAYVRNRYSSPVRAAGWEHVLSSKNIPGGHGVHVNMTNPGSVNWQIRYLSTNRLGLGLGLGLELGSSQVK